MLVCFFWTGVCCLSYEYFLKQAPTLINKHNTPQNNFQFEQSSCFKNPFHKLFCIDASICKGLQTAELQSIKFSVMMLKCKW